jgi:hypothetical protein
MSSSVVSSIISEIKRRLDGFDTNELLVHREVYRDLLEKESQVKIVIGDYGTGKTVAGRFLVNYARNTGDFAIHIHLRKARYHELPGINDRLISTMFYYIMNPDDLGGVTYHFYPEPYGNIFTDLSGKDESEYFNALSKKLSSVGRNMYIILDEFDTPSDPELAAILSSPESRAKEILILGRYTRNANSTLERLGRGIYIIIMAIKTYFADVQQHLLKHIESRIEDSLGVSRLGRVIQLPQQFSAQEYVKLLTNIANYFKMKYNNDDIKKIAEQLASQSIPLYLSIGRILQGLEEELEEELPRIKCNDLECIRGAGLTFRIPALSDMVNALRILEHKNWQNDIKKDERLRDRILALDQAHNVLVDALKRELASVGVGVKDDVEKTVLRTRINKLLLRKDNNEVEAVIMTRLHGPDPKTPSETYLRQLLDVKKEEIKEEKRIKKGMLPRPSVLLVIFRHKRVDVSDLRKAIEALFRNAVEVISVPLEPDQIYYLVFEGKVSSVQGETPLTPALRRAVEKIIQALGG